MRFETRSLTPPRAVRALWLQEALDRESSQHRTERLEAQTTADVCIVGGGFTGLWTALEIKRRSPSADVVLIDADLCGSGASGRNGGFAMTWWSKFVTLQKHCGTKAALALALRAEQAVDDIGRFCLEEQIDADFRQHGWLWTATNTAQVDAWRATLNAIAAAGAEPFEILSREQVAERSGSPVHLAGVHESKVATVQPALLARGLARVAKRAGVRIYEGTAMTELQGGEPARVRTRHGEVLAGVVVLAINAWASRIPQIGRALVVVSSDVIATEPIPEQLDSIGWRDGPAISDSRRLVNYYRTSKDGRVVFGKGGGTLTVTGHIGAAFQRESPRLDEVARQFRFIYPMLWDARIVAAWRGPVDYSITGLPFFCRLEGHSNVVVGAGFSGNGVAPAKLAGELLAEMATQGGDAGLPPALASVPKGSMPPEPVRYVGGRLVRSALARKEAREDLGGRVGAFTRLVAGLDPTSFVDRGGDGERTTTATPPLT
jgi:glycine/D-amino acid oxidase-like deaminating enzyme